MNTDVTATLISAPPWENKTASDSNVGSTDDVTVNVHWGDYKVLKRCLVRRWEDATKMEACLHSLWAKRKNLEETLSESQAQLGNIERCLPGLSAAIERLSKDIEQQQQQWTDIDKEVSEKQNGVYSIVQKSPLVSCPCRRFNAALDTRPYMSSVGGLRAKQEDIQRNVELMRAQLACKCAEKTNADKKKLHLTTLVDQVTRNLLSVNEECQVVNSRWKEYRCEVEKLQTQMTEQWGSSALDRLTPANVSRSRFF